MEHLREDMTDQSRLWADKYGINLGYLGMLYKNVKVFNNGYIICGNGEHSHEYEQILDKNLNIKYKIAACINIAPRVVWCSYKNSGLSNQMSSHVVEDHTREILNSIYNKNKDASNAGPLSLVMFRYSISDMIDSEVLEFVHSYSDQLDAAGISGWLKYDAFLVDNRNCIIPKIGSIYLENKSDRSGEFYSLTGIKLLKCLADVLNTFSVGIVKITKDSEVIQRPWSYLYETAIKEEFNPEVVSGVADGKPSGSLRTRDNQNIDIEAYCKEIDSLYERARQSEKAINFMLKLNGHGENSENNDKSHAESHAESHAAFKFLTDMPLGAATKFVTSDSVHYVTDIQWNNVDEVVMKVKPYFVNQIRRSGTMGLED